MKVSFDTIWRIEEDGTLTNKVKIRTAGVSAEPEALKGYKGVFGAVNWELFKGRDIDIAIDGDTWVLLGIY